MVVGQACELHDGHASYQYPPKVEGLDGGLPGELQLGADGTSRLQQGQEVLGPDITPSDLSVEIHRGGGDPLLRLRRPLDPVVGGNSGDSRDRAFLDEGAYLLDPLLQSRIQRYRSRRVEERAKGVDHPGDGVFGERRVPAEIRSVFPLYQDDLDLAVAGWLEVEGIDPEVVATVHDTVESLLVGEVESRFRHEEEERRGTLLLQVGSQPKLVDEDVRVFVNDSGHLLVDDLRGEGHGPVSQGSLGDDCA